MDAREAVRRAMVVQEEQEFETTASIHIAADDESEEALGELQVAEYIIFLLAIDTYIRYVEEATGKDDPEDEVIHKGIRLLRVAENDLDRLKTFLDSNLPSPTHKKLLERALAIRVATVSGISRRALQLRTLLARGGASTMRAVFETNRALKQVREATNAAMIDDADAALDLFAAIPLRNMRLAAWIDLAAKTAGSGELPANPVEAGSKEASDQAKSLLVSSVQEISTTSAEESRQAQDEKTDRLFQVQNEAEMAAKKALDRAGEPDEPLTRSETVGVAVAAAVAAVSDPSNPRNIPDTLMKLDDEQRAAALTDGKVLVAAGAGAGKSTTLIARTAYLIKERRQTPSKVLITSFNKKAADELKTKVAKAVGPGIATQMSVGTMHSLFKRFLTEYGNATERKAFEGAGAKAVSSSTPRIVQKLWQECYDAKTRPPPKLKDASKQKTQWAGNNVTPAEAKAQAQTAEEAEHAEWYEMYEGLKGSIPGWKPPCEGKAREEAEREYQEKLQQWRGRGQRGQPPRRRGTTFESYMAKFRPNGNRVGDFDDMLSMFRDLLVREPGVKKMIQTMFDHVMVDECQDLNQVQNDVIMMMTEHVTDGADGKSLWMVGDDKQSIYAFRGARPDLFTGLHGKEGWKTRMIRTNYRCAPEIVECANKLIAHNEDQIPMLANPAPHKVRGVASINVVKSQDEVGGAISAVETIKGNVEHGEDVADHAILCRTNKELHSYETACIIRGIPYARKGASSFLGSPETSAVLGYLDLVTGDDYSKMQKSLADVVDRPKRFFVSPDVLEQGVKDAFSEYARRTRNTIKNVNPMLALRDSQFQEILLQKIGKSGYNNMKQLQELADNLAEIQANTQTPGYTTKDLFNEILGLRGRALVTDPVTGKSSWVDQTMRESLKAEMRDAVNPEEDDPEDEDDDETKGLGNIAFLFELTKVDPTDPMDAVQDPSTPAGFKAKMDRFEQRKQDLRYDINAWEKEQEALPPDQRKPPPGVYLGTVHSVKGAEWKNCFVQMPKGKFPFERKPKPGEPPPDPEKMKREIEGERRLGYVALTRAISKLTVICPNAVGGKAAGVSPFVDEAGLTIGENVERPGAESSPDEGTPKTATDLDFSEGPDYSGEDLMWSVDAGETPAWNPEEN